MDEGAKTLLTAQGLLSAAQRVTFDHLYQRALLAYATRDDDQIYRPPRPPRLGPAAPKRCAGTLRHTARSPAFNVLDPGKGAADHDVLFESDATAEDLPRRCGPGLSTLVDTLASILSRRGAGFATALRPEPFKEHIALPPRLWTSKVR